MLITAARCRRRPRRGGVACERPAVVHVAPRHSYVSVRVICDYPCRAVPCRDVPCRAVPCLPLPTAPHRTSHKPVQIGLSEGVLSHVMPSGTPVSLQGLRCNGPRMQSRRTGPSWNIWFRNAASHDRICHSEIRYGSVGTGPSPDRN